MVASRGVALLVGLAVALDVSHGFAPANTAVFHGGLRPQHVRRASSRSLSMRAEAEPVSRRRALAAAGCVRRACVRACVCVCVCVCVRASVRASEHV